uniref:Uncharacterized protein n=1 Tax=Desertifilum tharense IPPAS B-1220 TaxID=1781255 RepID=A0ACD5GRZ5_9CYAN
MLEQQRGRQDPFAVVTVPVVVQRPETPGEPGTGGQVEVPGRIRELPGVPRAGGTATASPRPGATQAQPPTGGGQARPGTPGAPGTPRPAPGAARQQPSPLVQPFLP